MDVKTLELFASEEIEVSLEERVSRAELAIRKQFEAARCVAIAASGGKDSSVVANLVLNAARQFRADGGTPIVLVCTASTGVDNPEIEQLIRKDHIKMAQFGKQNGFEVVCGISTPTVLSSWIVKIASGRAIPSFAGTNTDCTIDLKVTPMRRLRKELIGAFNSKLGKEVVTCLGTRFAESERRAINMKARGEDCDRPVLNKDNELIMSPIAHWQTEDVWEYLGMASSNLIPSYSDFKDTLRVYAHSAGTSCAVVAEAIYEGGSKQRKGGCGARHGCWTCLQAEDKSLEAMLDMEPRYEYARGLNKFNKWLRATRYAWNLRHWVGRTIKQGYIAIQPDTYHPRMLRAMMRYLLQLQLDESRRAHRANETPKFNFLTLETMIAVDAMQSLNGIAKPFAIWADYRDIVMRGIRYDVPDVAPIPETVMPDAKFLFVGDEWDSSADAAWTGMRDPIFEALTDGACAPEIITLKNGKTSWAIATEQSFSVDSESAAMIMDFELDRLLEMHDRGFSLGGITSGYKWYLQYGCLNLSHAQKAEHDEVLRRTAFKDRLGLTLDYDIDRLVNMAVRFSDLTPAAREAWANKATTQSAQPELCLADD